MVVNRLPADPWWWGRGGQKVKIQLSEHGHVAYEIQHASIDSVTKTLIHPRPLGGVEGLYNFFFLK